MENEQKNRPTGENEAGGQNPEKRPGRNRRHRSHGKGNRPRPENAQANGQNPVPNAPEEGRKDRNRPGNGQQAQNNSSNNGGKNKNGNGGNRPHGNRFRDGGSRRGGFDSLYSPYEEPKPEELSLEELRARIVVKAADEPESKVEEVAETTPDIDIADVTLTEAPETLPPVDPDAKRVEVVGVRFRSSGKMYFFDPHGITAKRGEHAIVETARGPEFGDVCLGNTMVSEKDTVSPLRPILRVATPEDIRHNEENRQKEKEALLICRKKIEEHGLEMKLIEVQYAFDNSKLLFYFSADGRVDFRNLVKDLAAQFHTRIELRQIGIRDEAKMLGGIGACGRSLCCSRFLPDFAQVSIKMAKEQGLSLNSTKISGVCGRLMCCLRYESDTYSEEIRLTPAPDTLVKTEDGIGTVISNNPLAGTVRVILKNTPDTPPKQYHRDSVTVLGRAKRGAPDGENGNSSPEEKKE